MKPLKIFLLFLLFVIMGAFAYLITKFILAYLNAKKAFKACLFNKNQCGQKECTPPADMLHPPLPAVVSLSQWQTSTAKYAASLIYIIEKAANDENKPKPSYPKELTLQKELYNSKEDPVFGAVLSDDNFIWIALRGTISSREWVQDFTSQQEAFLDSKSATQVKLQFLTTTTDGLSPSVHKGFVDAYTNFRKDLLDTLEKIDTDKSKTIIVTGHSLGAGISTIIGTDITDNGYKAVVYNFASPRVGDNVFCDLIKSLKLTIFRIVNTADIVPTLPLAVSPNFKTTDKPYEYTHCGVLMAFTDNWKSILNNHLMAVYMTALKQM
jgi:triacylglycerol lipase